MTAEDWAAAEALFLEAAERQRELADEDIRRVILHVAAAGFDPAPRASPGGRSVGLQWQGRAVRGSDHFTSAEVHYLRHVRATQEWPVGTSLDSYLQSIREVVVDPTCAVFLGRFRGYWQVTFVRESRSLQGPDGMPWVRVEYRVGIGQWVTAFQSDSGPNETLTEPFRTEQRWLRPPPSHGIST